MPWHTCEGGDRILQGAEARLFANAIAFMIDEYDLDSFLDRSSEKNLNFGYKLIDGRFELLTASQKFAVLEEVAVSLLTNRSSFIPQQDEYNEGAIYYVFMYILKQFDDLDIGIECWGQQVIDAYNECFPDDEDMKRVSMDCMEEMVWSDAIEALADRILWDRDFEMFREAIPELLPIMGITNSYYRRPLRFSNARGAKERLYALVRRIGDAPQQASVSEAADPIEDSRPSKKLKKDSS
jgi:hypothetical protein